jgi:hypothetical protein
VLAASPLVLLIPDGARRREGERRDLPAGDQRHAGQHARDPGLLDA